MKCPHCKAEWNIPGQTTMLENCPFCGKKLAVKILQSTDTLEGVLMEIVSSFGVETLKDGRKTLGFFSDLAPQLKKEKLLLTHFINANRENIEAIFSARFRTETEQKVLFMKVFNKLVDEWAMREDAAALVCKGYFYAIGITIQYEVSSFSPKGISVSIQHVDSNNRDKVTSASTSCSTQIDTSAKNLQPISLNGKIDTYEKYVKALEDYFLSCFPNGESKHPLTLNQIEQFIKIYDLKSFWHGTVKDVEKDLLKIYRKYGFSGRTIISGDMKTWNQSNSSTSIMPKTSSTISKAETRPEKINTYRKYEQALEKYFLDTFSSGQSKCALTRQQIEYFINVNDLHSRFGIAIKDVETDLQKVYVKYGVTSAVAPSSSVRPNPTLGKTITNYSEYINTLTNIYLRNGKKFLSDSEIMGFLQQYNLERRFGIKIADVKTDLQSIALKYR